MHIFYPFDSILGIITLKTRDYEQACYEHMAARAILTSKPELPPLARVEVLRLNLLLPAMYESTERMRVLARSELVRTAVRT